MYYSLSQPSIKMTMQFYEREAMCLMKHNAILCSFYTSPSGIRMFPTSPRRLQCIVNHRSRHSQRDVCIPQSSPNYDNHGLSTTEYFATTWVSKTDERNRELVAHSCKSAPLSPSTEAIFSMSCIIDLEEVIEIDPSLLSYSSPETAW